MDQHGSSGFSDTDSSAGSSDHSQSRPTDAHNTSEPPPHTGSSSHFYTHPARTSVLSANGSFLHDQIPGFASEASRQGLSNMDDTASGGLPSFSRGFDMFFTPISSNDERHEVEEGFFVPSYLSDSIYLKGLKDAFGSRARGHKETKLAPARNGNDLDAGDFARQPLAVNSHRMVPNKVLQLPLPFEEDDALAPLPTRWNQDDMATGIESLAGGLALKFTGPRTPQERDHEAAAARTDHYMPPQCGIYYFETTILFGKRDDTTIAIGFSTKTASTTRPVGWESESWAYHGDDGRCFTGQNIGRPFGPTFSTGDVIGCGVDFRDRSAFFTKNGAKVGTAFHDLTRGRLYPTISLKKPGEHVLVNFGRAPFVFDIDGFMREQRSQITKDIENTDISGLEPELGESDLVQALVLQFLQHDGYVETARAFAEDITQQKETLRLDPNVTVDGINIKDDEDANNRQRIRRAILEGDIDRALKLTRAYYPSVFLENEEVHFKLRCRKFIEMVRLAAQYRGGAEVGRSNGSRIGGGGASTTQAMDVDTHGGRDPSWNEDTPMETEGQENQSELSRLEAEMLEYGQTLGAEYAGDQRKEVSKALGEIWALVAYTNPLQEPLISHLLEKHGRVAVAEELNSAILSSLGKSSRAALEKVYAQTSVLLEDLRSDGSAGAFVSVQDVIDNISIFPLS